MKYRELIKMNKEHKKEIESLKQQIAALEQKVNDNIKVDYIIKTEDNSFEIITKDDVMFIEDDDILTKDVLDVLKMS